MLHLLFLLSGCCLFGGGDPLEALRAEVLTGPPTTLAMATMDAAPDIPPLRPGELQPPPGGANAGTPGGLRVLGVAPQGEDRDPSQVAVVFDRPMVALDAIDATSATVPIRCTPPIDGRMRWAGTTTAVIVPTGNRFPSGTSYACSVPAGTASLDGTAVDGTISWNFATIRPAVKRTVPSAGTEDWDPADPIWVRFNQAVDPGAITPFVRLTGPGGAAVAITVSRGTEKQNQPELVRIHGPVQRDTPYTLTLAAGLPGEGGPLGMAADTAIALRTYPPLTLVAATPVGANESPLSPITVQFSTKVDASEVNRHLHLSPTPPDGWKPAEAYAGRAWSHWTRLDPRTTYTLTLDPGIKDTHGQTLEQGSTWQFTTGDLPAMVDAPSGFQVYPASNPLSLPIRYRNVSAVDLQIETLDPAALLSSPDRWTGWRSERGGTRTRITPSGVTNRIQVGSLDLRPFLSASGHGLLRIVASAPELHDWDGSPDESVALLQVTDLGTTLKLAPDGATTWVTRLSDGTPVAGASVQIVRSGRVVGTAVTDADGLATLTGDLVPDDWSSWREPVWALVRAGDDTALTSHQFDDGIGGWSYGVWSSFEAENAQIQFASFTDRGVYRLGDTAHVQLTVRDRTLDGLSVPAQRALTWIFRDPNGQELAEGTGLANDLGAWAVSLALPTSGALGAHTLEVHRGQDVHHVYVDVRAYRAPAFRMDVTAPAQARAGGTLEAVAEGRYLFGTPMKGARVQWSVGRAPLALSPKGFEAFSFDREPNLTDWSSVPGWESLSSGEGTLGPDGRLSVSQALPVETVTRPWSYEIEATVTDTDRQAVSNRASVPVHVADAYTGVRVATGLGTAGKPLDIQVIAATPQGEARPGSSVRLTALRRTWDVVRVKGLDGTWAWVNTPKDEAVNTGALTTSAQAATWKFTPAQGGYYVIRAEGNDHTGQPTIAETGVYVLGGQVSWARSDARRLELVADKRSYAPGDTATILVKAPRAGMRALVTVEREGVWSRSVVTLTSTAQGIEVPILPAMMPNAFVTVLGVDPAPPADRPDAGKPGIWYGITEIKVDAAKQRVEVAIDTDREAYQPGEEVALHLTAKRDGKALANARVTLWAVDHGVLSLTAYKTPNLHDTFYAPRALGVLTADNRISVYDRAHYLAKGGEVGGGGGLADGDVRRRFETTPLWAPDLRTSAEGRLDHRFKLPDNLTTFRIMAVVDDGIAAFGSGDHEVRVNRPLIARPALPRFFRVGDRVLAGVVVHNNTPEVVEVEVTAAATGARLQGAPRTVSVAADGALEVPFSLLDFTGASVKLTFTAVGGGNRDSVEVEVPVSSPLPQEVVATSGATTTDIREAVRVPDGALPGAGGLSVSVSASALVGMGSSVDYLLDYPHGCLEQVGSGLRVALLARSLGERAGVETPPEKLDDYVRVGLAKMGAFRTASGGFGYWPGEDGASGQASAYALEVLAEARAAGQTVNPEHIKGLTAYVREFLAGQHVPRWWTPEMTQAAQAKAALSLARAGAGDPGFNARLWDRRAGLPRFAHAQLLETLARTTGADSRTRALTEDLAASLHIEATSAALVERDRRDWAALWHGDDLGTSALVRAWMQAEPAQPLLGRLARHLVNARKQGRWANTYTTAEALQALRDYTARYETGAVTASVSLGGEPPLLQKALGKGGQASAWVPMSRLKPGDLLISPSGGRVYYESRLSYARERLPARDEGFTVTRTYEVLEGSGSGAQVTPGAILRVTLRVVTPVDRYNVALRDPLPAGLEPVDTTFATTARSGDGEDTGNASGGYDTGSSADDPVSAWGSEWVFNRRELRDDEVVLYADHMPAGIHVQSYLARATTPGDYAHPAAMVEQMYAPDTFGRTNAARFVVGFPVASR